MELFLLLPLLLSVGAARKGAEGAGVGDEAREFEVLLEWTGAEGVVGGVAVPDDADNIFNSC